MHTSWTKALMAVGALANVACYSTYDLPARSLLALDGFRDGEQRTIDTRDGTMEFDRSTALRFVDIEGHVTRPTTFSSIEMTDDFFVGQRAGTRGIDVHIELARIQSIHAKKFSGATTAAAILVPTGILVFGALVSLVVFALAGPLCFGGCIGGSF